MNRGLILKAARELWPVTLLFAVLLGVAESILAYVLPTFQEQLSAQWAQIKLLQTLVQAMLGTDASAGFGPEMFLSIPWVHPVVLALLWAHAIVCATRVPVGEVDRGTMDVLLGLPVSRWEVFISETVAVLASASIVLAMAWLGNSLGGRSVPGGSQVSLLRAGIVIANLFELYLAVAGLAWLVSSVGDRRGKAMTVVFVLVLASFLIHFLSQLWEPAKSALFLSIMGYYRPFFILRDGTWPIADMLVLAAIAAASWLLAGWIFSRRDLSTI